MVPVERRHLSRVDLTIKGFDPQERQSWTKQAWAEFGGNIVGIPRAYAARENFEIPFEMGREIVPIARPKLEGKWEYQERPVEDTVSIFQQYLDVIMEAYTGSGKTVMGCEIAARLGRTTLILVDQAKLMKQWRETLTAFFGYLKEEVGIVQGKNYDFANDFTIAMIQSVYDREHDDEFYEAFGTVLYDEVHVAGAEQFSAVLEMFPARYRLGLSATPDRKDELDRLIKLHLEAKRVVLRESRTPSRTYVVQYPFVGSWYGNTSPKTGRFISEIVEDGQRNIMLVQIIKWLHEQGRKALIIGERIEHLECLHAMAVICGIPESDTLLYTGKEHYYKLERNPEPSRDPSGYVKGTEYTPIHYPLKERRVNLSKRDDLLHERALIFSTFSVFSKGVDLPELDAGLEVTPRSSFVQTHGRILRRTTGKRIPIWVTIRDFNSSRAEYQFQKRIAEFVKSNAETFIWPNPGDGELVRKPPAHMRKEAEWRRETLKNAKTITDAGGNFTLLTTLTAPEFYRSNGNPTTVTRRRSRQSSREAS
jgi:superfamily II DNA or RNA helicase